jgi:type III pantothenate kinase
LNAAAAYARYRTDVIAVDLGTATTFSVVTASGEFLGGAIAPGLGTSAEALITRTARLPKVDLVPPSTAIGPDTIASLQSGLVLGHAGMVDSLVARMQQQLGRSTKVIATGGLAPVIAPISQSIQEVRPFLTLEGLELLYRRRYTHL